MSGVDESLNRCIPSALSDIDLMISNEYVVASIWIISLFAVIGNLFVASRSIRNIFFPKQQLSKIELINKSLIFNLSLSDLLVGIYILAICIKNATITKNYAQTYKQFQSGFTCSALGTLYLIGSESSVFTLTIVTGFRMKTVLRYDRNPLYSTINKNDVENLSRALLTKQRFEDDPAIEKKLGTWSLLESLISDLNSTFKVERRKTQEKNAAVSDKLKAERAIKMQKKITLIILTDFLCWMPVCVMGFLTVSGINIPYDAYVLVGWIIIPINSSLNPFLYSDGPDYVWEKLSPVRAWIYENTMGQCVRDSKKPSTNRRDVQSGSRHQVENLTTPLQRVMGT
uniref:G-protein coupled receptor GRL101-like n=1 Tax=Styela clava TaxID=7725 RepID=UPI00193A5259|nr:G-protein coupled receptor GRL101-like [Styela clava]